MATYYVDKIGETIKYRLGAWPDVANGTVPNPNDLNQLCFDVGVDHTIVLSARTWAGTEIDATDGLDLGRTGQTLRGPLSGDPGWIGPVRAYIDGTGLADHTVAVGAVAAYTLQNLGVSGAPATFANIAAGGGLTMEDVISTGAETALRTTAAVTVTASRCVFQGATSYALDTNATGSALNTALCKFIGNAVAVRHVKGAWTDKNSLFIGSGSNHIVTSGANGQTMDVTNSILGTWGLSTADAYGIAIGAGAGASVFTNCQILDNPRTKGRIYTGEATLTACITTRAPKFRSHRRPGIVSVWIDDLLTDAGGELFAPKLAAIAEQYGMRVSWGVTTALNIDQVYTEEVVEEFTPIDWTPMQQMAANGHDIISHTAHHVSLGLMDAFRPTYTGAGSACTLSYDRETHLLTTTVTGAADNVSLDVSGMTVKGVVDYLVATGKYTSTYSTDNMNALATDLAAVTNVNIKTAPPLLQLDQAATFATEIAGSKATIEANIPGYTVRSLYYPYFSQSADALAAVAAAGYQFSRGNSAGDYLMTSVRAHVPFATNVGAIIGNASTLPTEEQVKQRVNALAEYLQYVGGVYCFGAHSDNKFDTECTYEAWGWIFQALADNGIRVMTFSDAMQAIADSAEATTGEGGEITYTRSEAHLGDASDYHLAPGSPCINAGADVGLTTDFDGKAVPFNGVPDIGPYEFRPAARGGGLGFSSFRLGF